jgi:hypothetical protein
MYGQGVWSYMKCLQDNHSSKDTHIKTYISYYKESNHFLKRENSYKFPNFIILTFNIL